MILKRSWVLVTTKLSKLARLSTHIHRKEYPDGDWIEETQKTVPGTSILK